MGITVDTSRYDERTGLGLMAIAGTVGAAIAIQTVSGALEIGLVTAIATLILFGLLAGMSVLTVE